MSQRRSAQFGLLFACLILIAAIGILWAGNKDGMINRGGERQGVAMQPVPLQNVKLATVGK